MDAVAARVTHTLNLPIKCAILDEPCAHDMLAISVSAPKDETTWQLLSLIKSNILKRLDSAPAGVKICCVRFIQRVVYTQTPGLIADPRVSHATAAAASPPLVYSSTLSSLSSDLTITKPRFLS